MECFHLTYLQHLSRYVSIVLVLLYSANITHSWRPYSLILHSPTYASYMPDIMEYNCTIDENSKVSLHLNIKRDQTNAFLHVTYVFADKDGNYNLVYTNKTINLCAFLSNRKIDFVLRIFFDVGERFGQVPTHCPIRKKLFSITNMRISAENLPPVMPETKGILTFTWMGKVNGAFKTYLTTNVSFSLEKLFKPSGDTRRS